MKKIISTLLLLGSFSAIADVNYNYRRQSEVHCKTTKAAVVDFEVLIQNESKMGIEGYLVSNKSKVKIQLNGKFDGRMIKNLEKTIEFSDDTYAVDLALNSVYDIENKSGSVKAVGLSDLTGDETTPGISTKITVDNLLGNLWGGIDANANIVHSSGVGFASLNVGNSHFETVPLTCTSKGDTADKGEEYLVEFQK